MAKRILLAGLLLLSMLALYKIYGLGNNVERNCEDPINIKIIPFRDEYVDDDTYNAILANKKENIPCLIKSITDTRGMPDPRQAPVYGNVVVGDTALFVLLDVVKSKEFKEFLPLNIQKSMIRKVFTHILNT